MPRRWSSSGLGPPSWNTMLWLEYAADATTAHARSAAPTFAWTRPKSMRRLSVASSGPGSSRLSGEAAQGQAGAQTKPRRELTGRDERIEHVGPADPGPELLARVDELL